MFRQALMDFVQWPKQAHSEAWRSEPAFQRAARLLVRPSWQALTSAGSQPEPIEMIQLQAAYSGLGAN